MDAPHFRDRKRRPRDSKQLAQAQPGNEQRPSQDCPLAHIAWDISEITSGFSRSLESLF